MTCAEPPIVRPPAPPGPTGVGRRQAGGRTSPDRLARCRPTPEVWKLIEPFRYGLREHGYVEGQNLLVEYRWAEGPADFIKIAPGWRWAPELCSGAAIST